MYFPNTPEELAQIRAECLRLVDRRALVSGAAAAVPLPGVDISVDLALLAELLTTVNRRFGLSQEQLATLDRERLQILLIIITSVGSELAGRNVSVSVVRNLLKRAGARLAARRMGRFVPVAGQAVSAGVSFAAMRALGRNHVEQCYQIALRYMQETDARFNPNVIDI